jgi:hypothetical protein
MGTGYLFSGISLSKSSAESGLEIFELLIIAAGFVLTLGAIGEYLEDHKRLPSCLNFPKLVFIVMVVAGLIGEFVGDAGVFVFSGSLQSIQDEETNRIVDIFGPRHPERHAADIVKSLTGLESTKIDVYIEDVGDPPDSPEFKDSLKTGSAVLRLLEAAHMNAEGWILNSCQGGHAEGLNVTLAWNANNNDRKIAQQVLDSFPHELGTFSTVQDASPIAVCNKFSDLDSGKPNDRQPDAAISITIGRKINPILTREMLEPTP